MYNITKVTLLKYTIIIIFKGSVMELSTFEKKGDESLYVQLYNFFRRLIENGQLEKNSKMMSIRRCCEEFGLSKTTVENAYLQLAAEGYIISKPQSGYYVCELEFSYEKTDNNILASENDSENIQVEYDFTSSSLETDNFDFSLWQRYIKSALRKSERLICYGEAQGEADLRNTLSQFIKNKRGVICSGEQIVIGAGTQSLLSILCSIMPSKTGIAFIGASFERGEAVFESYGFKCLNFPTFPENLDELNKENIGLIYISPSHFTSEGDILTINKRLSLLRFAKENNCLIIEDDYDSEFRYYSKTIPSLQSISGGNEVIYLSAFSKLLIPSIRISFMVLPSLLLKQYRDKGTIYNQTASKLEQIALCQFIRDGHLNLQIKKQRKVFSQKSKALCDAVNSTFGTVAKAAVLPAGYLVKVKFTCAVDAEKLKIKALSEGIRIMSGNDNSIILSCTSVGSDQYLNIMKKLKNLI